MRNTLENKYTLIWEKYKKSTFFDILTRGWAFHYDHDEENSDVLFVGLNPSYKENSGKTNGVFDKSAQHRYFRPFQIIHNELIETVRTDNYKKWTHIDVLAIRETNQNQIKIILSKEKDLVLEQVLLAKERILHIKPTVMVVCNTMARELIRQDSIEENGFGMGFKLDFNEEFGSHTINNAPELKHTHVLFSSMLSGQRALDLGSRERLVWQIKRILKSR